MLLSSQSVVTADVVLHCLNFVSFQHETKFLRNTDCGKAKHDCNQKAKLKAN